MEGIHTVNTGAVPAGVVLTIINVDFTELAGEACFAFALVSVDQIEAFAAMFAWVPAAVVNVDFTIDSSEADGTAASISVDLVEADARPTWTWVTFVDILLTANSLIP